MLIQSGTIAVPTISQTELKNKLDNFEEFEFWNVLTDEYYSFENIPGSRHIPLDHIGREVAKLGLSSNAEIVVYCTGPECMQSSFAFEKLYSLGYRNVRVYKGGLDEWETEGLPLTTYQVIAMPQIYQLTALIAYN